MSTDKRQTSWLFAIMTEEMNLGLPRNKSSLVVRAGLEPATSKSSALTTNLGHAVSFINCMQVLYHFEVVPVDPLGYTGLEA